MVLKGDRMLSILIPVYNEAQQLPFTHEALLPILEATGEDFELLFVDDGSSDTTWKQLQQFSVEDPRIRGIRLSRNFGKEAALCAGLDHVLGDAVLLMDGDLQHPPELLPEFLRLHREGYDIVDGVKQDRGTESRLGRWFAKSFYQLYRSCSGIDLNNASDYKLLDRQVVEAWKQLQERTTFFRGMVEWVGFKHAVVPFSVSERTAGQSKWSQRQLWKLAWDSITSFSSRPLQIITYMGAFFLLLGFGLGIQTLIHFFRGRAFAGFTTVILLQLWIGGSILISLGLIGLYLARIFDEIKGRPRYLIAEETPRPGPNKPGENGSL